MKPKQWEIGATYGSDILGTGSCFGNVIGESKTAQIGFVRSSKDVRGKGGISNKGRSKKASSLRKQKERG